MERPSVAERRVRVRIERPLLGQSPRRPILPPVEVPLKTLVQGARVAIEVADPSAPGLLIGALQVAQVVDLEARRAPLVAGLAQEVRPAHLAELQLLGVSRARRARRVVREPGVGSLTVLARVALRA